MIFDQKWQFSTEFEMIPTYRQGTFQPFSSEKWILAKIYGFSKKSVKMEQKSISMILSTKRVFYYRIQELANPTKLNLFIALVLHAYCIF